MRAIRRMVFFVLHVYVGSMVGAFAVHLRNGSVFFGHQFLRSENVMHVRIVARRDRVSGDSESEPCPHSIARRTTGTGDEHRIDRVVFLARQDSHCTA